MSFERAGENGRETFEDGEEERDGERKSERMKVPERAGNVFPNFFSSLEEKKNERKR